MEGRKTETEREDGSCDGRNTDADKYEEDNTRQDGYETMMAIGDDTAVFNRIACGSPGTAANDGPKVV